MDCLEDYIGAKGCTDTTPESGLYINNLQGIELKNMAEVANEQQATFQGVWDDVQTRALNRFEADVIAHLNKRFKLKRLTQTLNTGKEKDTSTTTASSNQYRGITAELNDEGVDYVNSIMQVFYIQKINIYLTAQADITLKVFDLDTEEVLLTKTVASADTTANAWNAINIEQMFRSRRIFVGYDCSSITSISKDLSAHNLNHFGRCGAKIRGATASTADPYDVTQGDEAHGLTITMSIRCDYSVLVCNNRELFSMALLYLLGVELMNEIINSSRKNRWTTVDREDAIDLRDYFESMYYGGQREDASGGITSRRSSLEDSVMGIYLDSQADCCIDCTGQYSAQDSLI